MTRPTLAYRIRWTPELHGYAYNATRRYWRKLAPWYEWEDLMQEALLVFLVCQRNYQGKVDNPAWFMALYKRSWSNRLFDLSKRKPKYSLLEDWTVLDQTQAAPSAASGLGELIDQVAKLPLGLRISLSEMCKPKGRFRVSRRTVQQLAATLGAT